MVLIPLVLVLAVVGIVLAVRRSGSHLSAIGRWSLIVLGAAVVFWLVTFSTLPIYFAAVIAATSLVLAVVAVIQYHDRSPLLLLPLVSVPLSAALSAAFVILS